MTENLPEHKSWLDKPILVLVKIQRLLLILTSLGLAISVSLMALLRYFFQINLFGIEEFILICGMWLYFVGAANGSFERSQISASVIDLFVKNPKVLWGIHIFQQALTVALFVVFCVYAVDFLQFSVAAGAKTQVHKIPFAVSHAAITINVILMAFYSALHLFRDIYGKIQAKKQPAKPAEPLI